MTCGALMCLVRLVRSAPGELFFGGMLVLAPEQAGSPLGRAKITVEVMSDAGDCLLRRRLVLSPVDEAVSFSQFAG